MSDTQIGLNNASISIGKMGFFKRVTGVIFSPGKVMENLAARPRVLFPLILIAVSLLALCMSRLPLYKNFLRESAMASSQFTESLTGVKTTPEMIEQHLPTTLISSVITTPLASLFGWLLITAVFFTLFKIAGGKGRFKQYLSVTGYAYVIMAFYYIIVFGVSFFTGSLHLTMPLTSLANLFSSGLKGNFFYGMLRGLDVFGIWRYAVIAIGMVVISGLKKNTAYGIVAGVFIITLLITGIGEARMGTFL